MKKMKKVLALVLAAALVVPALFVSGKASAAELTADEILTKMSESGASLKSCDETFSMELGFKMKGIGSLVNVKLEGTGTEFMLNEQMPEKVKADAVMTIDANDMLKPTLEDMGLSAGKYNISSYVIAAGTESAPAMDVYAYNDIDEESEGWTKTTITYEQLMSLVSQYGAGGTVDAVSSGVYDAKNYTVTEEGNTYVLNGKISITKKMVKDTAKEMGMYKDMSKKEKKEFNKQITNIVKQVKPMKVTYVVDKETFVTIKETVDFKAYANSLLKAAFKSTGDKDMIKAAKQISLTGCTIESTVSNVNNATDFTLPQEAASAKVVPFEDLMGELETSSM